MTTERVEEEFVRECAEPEEPSPRHVKAPKPARCKAFARARFAEAMPAIMTRLLTEVLAGSVPHLKVLIELTGLDKAEAAAPQTRRKEKSLEQILIEQWKRDGEEEAARNAAREAAANAA